ncbi:ParA family protein [Prevotella histicola]|uniref:ParA family protein n=1 Tax=Prevotella histicola TaxID=470565 RepID=UPI0028EC1361|nr:ParA family protein [Prevotella histicola]
MKKKPVFIAFSTQKGGVGKTTFTVLAASYLHYVCGYNLIVVDCDYPQFSINAMRQRDAQGLERNPSLQELAVAQFSDGSKSTYTILCSTADTAVETVREYLETNEPDTDFVFFDLPGTINNDGVVNTLSGMDYIFTPISADRISLESTLSFASVIKTGITDNPQTENKGIYLFWNMVDGREKTPLYALYETVIAELGLPLLPTAVPNTTRYKKEATDNGATLFRSTIFPPSRTLLRGSKLKELVEDILNIIRTEDYGREE